MNDLIQELKNILKSNKDYLTFITIIVYAIGLIHNLVYFGLFGVDFIAYTPLSEILLKSVIDISLAILIYSFVKKLLLDPFENYIAKKKQNSRKLKTRNRLDALYMMVIGPTPLVLLMLSSDLASNRFLFYAATISYVYAFFYLYDSQVDNFNQKRSFHQHRHLKRALKTFAVFIPLTFIVFCAHMNFSQRISEFTPQQITVISTDRTYDTRDSVSVVGETSMAMFLYNFRDSSTVILNKSDILNVKIKNERKLTSFFVKMDKLLNF